MSAINDLIDQLIVYLPTEVTFPPNTSIQRTYDIDENFEKVEGLKVRAMPLRYGSMAPKDRREDEYDCVVAFVIFQRWNGEARPSNSWLDNLVNIAEQVFDAVSEIRNVNLMNAIGNFYPYAAELTIVYDYEFLKEHKVFWSEMEITYRK